LLGFGFLIASVAGWFCEEICVYLVYGYFYKRGMLHLTLCPIYGFGACGIYLLLQRVKKIGWFFLLSMLIASGFEYASSVYLEIFFHRNFWSYHGWPFSFDDRISLLSSLFFAVMACIFVYILIPFLRQRIQNRDEDICASASLLLMSAVLSDFILVLPGL